MRSYARSQAMHARALRVTPGGAQTASKAPGRVGPVGAFPLYLAGGSGAYVWDVDGNRYVDWYNGNAAVTLGHADNDVCEAVEEALRDGVLLSLPTEWEVDVAERLVARVPCAEQVRFTRTGSEAVAAAVRIARTATERDHVAVCRGQYGGWHDWSVARGETRGVPGVMRDLLRVWDYGDVESLRRALRAGPPCAAVVLEPLTAVADMDDMGDTTHFLQDVVDAARETGTVVVFDDMVVGGRWAYAGTQAYTGVVPDLVTFGKALANGHAFACVAGPERLMRHASTVSGTYGGEVVGLAAAGAVMDAYDDGAVARLWRAGEVLVAGASGALVEADLPAYIGGWPCRPVLRWASHVADRDVMASLLQQELAEHGVLVHPSAWNPSAAHGPEEVALTVEAFRAAARAVADARTSGDPAARLRGAVVAQPPVGRPW